MQASDITTKRKTRVEYSNYIIQKQRLNQGCANRINMNPNDSSSFSEITVGGLFTSVAQQDAILAANSCDVLPTVITVSAPSEESSFVLATGNVISIGNSPLLARGFVWNLAGNPTLADNVVIDAGTSVGVYSDYIPTRANPLYVKTYATNSGGTSYGNEIQTYANLCLAKGTLITLYDGTYKYIEDITYEDVLLVWDFDNGIFSSARPLWIKKVETAKKYNLLEFTNGYTLKTIVQHRIYNIEQGKFTWPMTEDTPIGTHTFTDSGKEVMLEKKSVIQEDVDYYNILTNYHLNLFANGILTSSKYNNIYPIVHMKFVKEERNIPRESYNVPDNFYYGLRMSEQIIPIEDTIKYIANLQRLAL